MGLHVPAREGKSAIT
jgi:vacuolar-type H+-ATPase catalytic subunit A/Vma1